jgi:hypothetical protein
MVDANKKGTALFIPHGGGPLPLLDESLFHNMNQFLLKRYFRKVLQGL